MVWALVVLGLTGYVLLMPAIAYIIARRGAERQNDTARMVRVMGEELAVLKSAVNADQFTRAQPEATSSTPLDQGSPSALKAAARAAPEAKDETVFEVVVESTPQTQDERPPASEEPGMSVPKMVDIEAAFTSSASANPCVTSPIPASKPTPKGRYDGWELRLGGNWSMWIGAAALTAGVVMLVRYMVEVGVLNDTMRVGLGVTAGLVMIATAEWLRRTGRAQPLLQYAEASLSAVLAVGGVSAIYASLYAAMTWYGLLSPTMGFAFMALAAGGAVALSLWHGVLLAIVGLAGAYGVPLFVASEEPDVLVLFGYLAMVSVVGVAVARREGWAHIRALPVMGSAMWLSIWSAHAWTPGDGVVVATYLAALLGGGAVLAGQTKAAEKIIYSAKLFGVTREYGVATIVDAMAGILTAAGLFVLVRMDGYGPISVAAGVLPVLALLVVAWRNERLVGLAALAALAVAAALATWTLNAERMIFYAYLGDAKPSEVGFMATVVIASVLFALTGQAAAWRTRQVGWWSALSAIAPVVLVGAGYGRDWIAGGDRPWMELALTLALANAAAAAIWWRIKGREAGAPRIAAHILGALAALCLLAAMQGEEAWLIAALGLSLTAVAWVRIEMKQAALEHVIAGITLYILVRLLIDPVVLSVLRYGVGDAWLVLPAYGAPILGMTTTAWLLNGLKEKPARGFAAELTLGGAVVCALLMINAAVPLLQLDWIEDMNTVFLERSLKTAAALGLGYALYRADGEGVSRVVGWAWRAIFAIVTVYVVTGPLVTANPISHGIAMGRTPVFSPLLVAYGAPGAVAVMVARVARARGNSKLLTVAGILGGVLLFAYVNLEIRHVFVGPYLNLGSIGGGEMYAYSVAWLVFAASMMVYGFVRDLAVVRKLALGLVAVTVLKVFLIDLGALEGLLRALSFLGLGASLMGLGYAYQRMNRAWSR